VTLAVGLGLVMPHLVWAAGAQFPTFDYVMSKTIFPADAVRFSAIKAVSVSLASLGVAALVYVLVFRQLAWPLAKRAMAGTFHRDNAWLACLVYAPLALTIAACLFGNVLLNWAYLIPAFFALPIVFLVLSQAQITPAVVRRLAFLRRRHRPARTHAQPDLRLLEIRRSGSRPTPGGCRGGDGAMARGLRAPAALRIG
jgi:hypothetical protein